ncbi:MAG: CBS domain-containing protein [Rhodocyclaceae bacterium]|nr:CBS domain-containing protein [Rhodocyclaceae bacterium]
MLNISVRRMMRPEKALQLPPETTVLDAAKKMAAKNIGAVMIVEHDNLRGIFTERDVMCRVLAKELDPANTCLNDVMTPDPRTVSPDKTYGHALVMMQENGFRHAPVVENGKPIGIISARNAMDPDLEEFAAEVYRREAMRNEGS